MQVNYAYGQYLLSDSLGRFVAASMSGVAGLTICVACETIGTAARHWLPVPIPGNVLGLAILFVLLHAGIVPEALVRAGAEWLLKWRAAFLVPIQAACMANTAFWTAHGWVMFPAVVIGVILMVISVGLISRIMVRS